MGTKQRQSFRPVFFKYETIKGHTPRKLAATSMSSGMSTILLIMGFCHGGREAIQSRSSAPFSLFRNEFRHRAGIQSAKHAWQRPLQAAFEKAQVKQQKFNQFLLKPTVQIVHVCLQERMWTAVHWNPRTLGPNESMTRPNTTTSSFTLLMKQSRIDTQTRQNWLLSQHRMKAQKLSPRSSNSMPH